MKKCYIETVNVGGGLTGLVTSCEGTRGKRFEGRKDKGTDKSDGKAKKKAYGAAGLS